MGFSVGGQPNPRPSWSSLFDSFGAWKHANFGSQVYHHYIFFFFPSLGVRVLACSDQCSCFFMLFMELVWCRRGRRKVNLFSLLLNFVSSFGVIGMICIFFFFFDPKLMFPSKFDLFVCKLLKLEFLVPTVIFFFI